MLKYAIPLIALIPLLLGGKMNAEPLTVGSPAPLLVQVIDQNHQTINLTEKFKSGWTLVYFYPKADTPGCTKEACSLRDHHDVLTQMGLTIYGVSTDKVESQKAFQDKYKLPFTLLADPDAKIAQAFGVPTTGGYAKRISFLIHDGKIVWSNPSVNVETHIEEVQSAMKKKSE